MTYKPLDSQMCLSSSVSSTDISTKLSVLTRLPLNLLIRLLAHESSENVFDKLHLLFGAKYCLGVGSLEHGSPLLSRWASKSDNFWTLLNSVRFCFILREPYSLWPRNFLWRNVEVVQGADEDPELDILVTISWFFGGWFEDFLRQKMNCLYLNEKLSTLARARPAIVDG